MNFIPDTSRHVATPLDDKERQGPTPTENLEDKPDLSRFTHSVAEVVITFKQAGMSISDRTVQRYCHSQKLKAIKVDPDTRQSTDRDNYLFLIDPSSIGERIAALREKGEISGATDDATRRVLTRHVATSRDKSEGEEQPKKESRGVEDEGKIEKLQEKIRSLEIDKAVRDARLEQFEKDREQLLGQIGEHMDYVSKLSREIGSLETKLQLAAPQQPEPGEENENNITDAEVVDDVHKEPWIHEEEHKI
ncbi:MAG: hypothetical protein C0605_17670 [Hyphomicrobiales bacterium]|jgi:hypothetical protein|nr:MAG: hypothetical protein C0605_17670 [Hyphomicrobiales bacterium]